MTIMLKTELKETKMLMMKAKSFAKNIIKTIDVLYGDNDDDSDAGSNEVISI